jgi:hypothetical protein
MALGVDNGPRQGFELDNLQATILDAAYDDVRFELTIWASEDRDNVVLRYTYTSNLFTEDAIRRAHNELELLISAILQPNINRSSLFEIRTHLENAQNKHGATARLMRFVSIQRPVTPT